MEITVKEGGLSITRIISEEDATATTILLAAYDLISRLFSQSNLIEAYQMTDPCTMGIRETEQNNTQKTDV